MVEQREQARKGLRLDPDQVEQIEAVRDLLFEHSCRLGDGYIEELYQRLRLILEEASAAEEPHDLP